MSQFAPIDTATAHTNPNVKPLAQAWGDRVSGTNLSEAAGPNVARAGLLSTAPYVEYGVETKAKEEKKQAGLEKRAENVKPENFRHCSHQGCKAPARRGSERCRWHPEELG